MFIAIAWYECEADYLAVAELVPFEESRNMVSYSHWLAKVESFEQDQRQKGNTTVRVKVEPKALQEWVDNSAAEVTLNRKTIEEYAMRKMASNGFQG